MSLDRQTNDDGGDNGDIVVGNSYLQMTWIVKRIIQIKFTNLDG